MKLTLNTLYTDFAREANSAITPRIGRNQRSGKAELRARINYTDSGCVHQHGFSLRRR